jgi:hypothetical protein
MDPAVMGYYALICGALAVAAPQWRHWGARFAAGVVVGVIAAGMAPFFRAWIGAG